MQKAAAVRSALASALFALAACSGDVNAPSATPDTPLVDVVSVQPSSAAGAVRASGLVGYRREPPLAFAAPGVVISIEVDAGDLVRRGQRLATLRRTSVGANADEAALARANAERDLARAEDLFARGFVSQARLDEARLAVERMRDFSALTAPSDGVILRRSAEPSQTLSAGSPVLVLGETGSGIVVRAPLASADAARVHVGDAAEIRLAEFDREAITGRVTRVGAKGDASTGAFEVEVETADATRLRSGMVAQVIITPAWPTDNVRAAILVPTLSLLDARADQGVVFVVDENSIARRRAVRTAGVTQDGVIVLEGLTAGERVISAGAAYVRDGEAVRVAAES